VIYVIGILVVALFVLGLNAAQSFKPTIYGRSVQSLADTLNQSAWKHPLLMVSIVLGHNLLVFLLLCLLASLPGGALWLIPWLGVNAGLIADGIEMPESFDDIRMPRGIFVVLSMLVMVIEGSLFATGAIMATLQGLDMTVDGYRGLGVLLVLGPVTVPLLSLGALFEVALVHGGPQSAPRGSHTT
jgi:hypothetical protein